MSTKHTLTIEHEVRHQPAGMGLPADEFEVSYPKIEITVNYTAGSPAVMYQRNGDPGWPGDPAEIDVIEAKLVDGDGLNPTPDQVLQWAQDYLDGDGFGFVEQQIEAQIEERRADR